MKRAGSFDEQERPAVVKKGCLSRFVSVFSLLFFFSSSFFSSHLRHVLDELSDVFSSPNVEFSVVAKRFYDAVEKVPTADWTSFAHFDGTRYSRNLLAAQENFSLIMNCWEVSRKSTCFSDLDFFFSPLQPGQATPVHSHEDGKGSTGSRLAWSFVLEGDLLLACYSDEVDAFGGRRLESTVLLNRANPRFAEETPRKFHVLENINRTHRAMTLHL